MKKTKVKMNKPVYLGMSILDISKTLMYEFWYDYIIPRYKDKAKLCYMDTDSFVINIFIEDFFEDINNDFERWFDRSNYDKNDKNYQDSLFNNNTILRSQLRFKGDLHNVYTEEVNKIALSSTDDKGLQTFDRITAYPYETNAYKVCESEMMALKKYE